MKIAIDATVLWGSSRYSGVEKMVDRVIYRLISNPGGDEYRVFAPHDWAGFEEANSSTPGGPPGHVGVGGQVGTAEHVGTAGQVSTRDPEENPAIFRLPFSGARRLVRIGWQQLILPNWLDAWQADVLFCPAYVMPIRARQRTIVYVHDLHGLQLSRTRLPNFVHHRLILPPTLKRASAILTPTLAVRDQVRALTPPGTPVTAASLGVDPEFTPRTSPIGPDIPYVLFVGNLEQRKGLHLLLEAFALVHKQRPELALRLVGKDRGLLSAIQQQAARLGIRAAVHCQGFVHRAKLTTLYQNAAVVVLPSLAEGFGLTPLEAMACGIPVAAVDSPAVRENLGDAALLCSPEASSLAEALLGAYLNPKLRRTLRAAGLERASRFTWDSTTQIIRAALTSR